MLGQSLLVTQVQDPFGRYTSLFYDSSNRLSRIVDEIGITSQVAYDDPGNPNFVNMLITPYGTNTFVYTGLNDGSGTETLVATDPLGQQEEVQFTQAGIQGSEAVVPAIQPIHNGNLGNRNTYYWNKQAMAQAPNDYTAAHIYHWMHGDTVEHVCSGTLESEKMPLENRVWYTYPGEDGFYGGVSIVDVTLARPQTIGRVMDDGTTSQIYSNEYNNPYGNLTKSIDPLGRTTTYVYDPTNGIDLLEVHQSIGTTNDDLLAKYTYNSQHKPLLQIDASGQTDSGRLQFGRSGGDKH